MILETLGRDAESARHSNRPAWLAATIHRLVGEKLREEGLEPIIVADAAPGEGRQFLREQSRTLVK